MFKAISTAFTKYVIEPACTLISNVKSAITRICTSAVTNIVKRPLVAAVAIASTALMAAGTFISGGALPAAMIVAGSAIGYAAAPWYKYSRDESLCAFAVVTVNAFVINSGFITALTLAYYISLMSR